MSKAAFVMSIISLALSTVVVGVAVTAVLLKIFKSDSYFESN